jgi:hypothetical protein
MSKPESTVDYKVRQKAAGVGTDKYYHDERVNTFANSPVENRTPTDSFHRRGDQLKLFMTPREIEKEWQPLDGDRRDAYHITYGKSDTRAGSSTYRARRTDGQSNFDRNDERTVTGAVTDSDGHKDMYSLYNRPGNHFPMERTGSSGLETDDEVWDRKYAEALDSPSSGYNHDPKGPRYRKPGGESTDAGGVWRQVTETGAKTRQPASRGNGWYRQTSPVPGTAIKGAITLNSRRRGSEAYVPFQEIPGSGDSHHSMVDSIIGEGIKSPIRLGLQHGMNDKPQLLGGHHRMAVARQDTPDRLAPVLYDNDMDQARSTNTKRSYKYT